MRSQSVTSKPGRGGRNEIASDRFRDAVRVLGLLSSPPRRAKRLPVSLCLGETQQVAGRATAFTSPRPPSYRIDVVRISRAGLSQVARTARRAGQMPGGWRGGVSAERRAVNRAANDLLSPASPPSAARSQSPAGFDNRRDPRVFGQQVYIAIYTVAVWRAQAENRGSQHSGAPS